MNISLTVIISQFVDLPFVKAVSSSSSSSTYEWISYISLNEKIRQPIWYGWRFPKCIQPTTLLVLCMHFIFEVEIFLFLEFACCPEIPIFISVSFFLYQKYSFFRSDWYEKSNNFNTPSEDETKPNFASTNPLNQI